jgi:hypothetical protein
MESLFKFGTINPSSIQAKVDGECIDFTYFNTLTHYPNGNTVQVELLGHQIVIALEKYTDADVLSVIPLSGWEAVTTNSILVNEWTSGVVRICQILLG